PVWSVAAGGGTISGAGLFTAGTVAGVFANTVTATAGGVSGAASVTVAAGALATIAVTPSPATVPSSTSQQFTALGEDVNGNPVAITPTWTASSGAGTIDGSGLYTAGTAPGTYPDAVQATSGSISGVATVTVTVNLGMATSFALLGGSGASSCTGSTVFGDAGADPNGTITGFPSLCSISPPGDGILHHDATATAAQVDLSTAISTLVAMPCTTNLTGLDLGTRTLAPGVYCFATTAQLTGTVTLDGPATGLWVFKIGTALTTAAGGTVTLAGGAKASNVYWQLGTSATFGASNAFQGNLVASGSITFGAGTTLAGRALVKVAVTMDTDTITLP
ncbi:MAG: ice-binding family protein, partial [Gemmatimonadota bacterium]